MKPEDLIPPFKKEERRTYIYDGVWYIPPKIDPRACRSHPSSEEHPFLFPGWHGDTLFGNSNPIHVEYCSGNGAWIAERAMASPDINWVAVEKKFDRVRKIWSKKKNFNIANLIVICGEAEEATERFFPASSIAKVYINFPDPWPKLRHTKNRLIHPTFVVELWRILQSGGSVHFVTDDRPYSDWFIEMMPKHAPFVSQYPAPYFAEDEPGYGSSYFESLWREKGRTILFHQYVKH